MSSLIYKIEFQILDNYYTIARNKMYFLFYILLLLRIVNIV